MHLQIKALSGELFDIPPRLLDEIEKVADDEIADHVGGPAGGPASQRAVRLLGLAQESADRERAALAALGAAGLFAAQSEPEQAILGLGLYAQRSAQVQAERGSAHSALAFWADALTLVHGALPYCRPEAARPLTGFLAQATDDAFTACAAFAQGGTFTAADDVAAILDVTAVVWGPELEAELGALQTLLPRVAKLMTGGVDKQDQPAVVGRLAGELGALRQQATLKLVHRARTQARLHLLQQLIDSWLEALRLNPLPNPVEARGDAARPLPSAGSLDDQVQARIAEVERRLRAVISHKYEQQFGPGWVQHVAARHATMHQYWVQNMQRDKAAFKAYKDYSPQILEYARFEDLTDLVAAQWHLFRDLLDFGYGDRNKATFCDIMKQIARVRNPLAHHRMIPENELLRAKVLCTDVLNLLGTDG